MTQPNPFEPTQVASGPALRQLPALPMQLAGVMLAASLMGILVSLIGGLMNDGVSGSSAWLLYAVMYWITHLLMAGLGTYWLAQAYLERHDLASYRQPAALLGSYGLIYLLLAWALGYLSGFLYMWIYDQVDFYGLGQWPMALGMWLFGLLGFCLKVLLLLWLLLHMFRYKAEAVGGDVQVSAVRLAWCFALAMAVAYLQLAGLATQLWRWMSYDYTLAGWEVPVNLVQGALFLLVAFFAARSVLPEQVRGFRGGRLALAVLITLALWMGSALLGAIVLVALVLFGGAGEIALMVGFGLLQLALLWPFSRLGLRWGYRARDAQA